MSDEGQVLEAPMGWVWIGQSIGLEQDEEDVSMCDGGVCICGGKPNPNPNPNSNPNRGPGTRRSGLGSQGRTTVTKSDQSYLCGLISKMTNSLKLSDLWAVRDALGKMGKIGVWRL